jgi:hypothetical protein
MLGYSEISKGAYLVQNVRTGAILYRYDCLFDDSVFEVLRECQKDPLSSKLVELF